VWETTVDGRVLHFHLAGINNQNFIMRDEETGTWWQQVSGEAILGPLKGHKLKSVFHDEISFGLWKREKPGGRILRPDERILAANNYAPSNWEERMGRAPVLPQFKKVGEDLEPRATVVGIKLNGAAKAYPLTTLQKQSPIIDNIGGVPIVILVGEDNRSVRAFETTVEGRKLEFFVKPGVSPLQLMDAENGSLWDFSGRATAGPLAGRQLRKVAVLEDYWFDWKLYNPKTAVYEIGPR
jgi:hypothetical protein